MNRPEIYLILTVFVLGVCTSDYVYKTKYLNVPLDHFTFNDNRTFQLRFLINDKYWRKQYGPIFFYAGNEGNVEMFAKNTGFLWETAKRFKALVVFAEHRFYGKSMPFGNLSYTDPKYFGYLSSQQALADFVDVIYYIKSHKSYFNDGMDADEHLELRRRKVDNPVIVFGGSYGGMLAAWFRIKYPAVVEGALASSAPIWYFNGLTPCNAFYEVVTSIFNSTTNKQCATTIRKSWDIITQFASNDTGRNWLSQNWKLCSNIKNDNDTIKIKDWLINTYVNVGMTNYPYSTNFLMPLPANPVNVLCANVIDSSKSEELLLSIFNAVTVYFNWTGTAKCLNWNEDPSPGLGANGWDIQSCTEMVMPMCTNGKSDMFEPAPWNFKEFSDDCYARLKTRPILDYALKEYGGKDISTASNIIFSNGLLDPWSSGGVLYNVSSTAIAIIIPESAHHLDLRDSNPDDPITIRKARMIYRSIFRRWIRNYYKRHGFFHINDDEIHDEYM